MPSLCSGPYPALLKGPRGHFYYTVLSIVTSWCICLSSPQSPLLGNLFWRKSRHLLVAMANHGCRPQSHPSTWHHNLFPGDFQLPGTIPRFLLALPAEQRPCLLRRRGKGPAHGPPVLSFLSSQHQFPFSFSPHPLQPRGKDVLFLSRFWVTSFLPLNMLSFLFFHPSNMLMCPPCENSPRFQVLLSPRVLWLCRRSRRPPWESMLRPRVYLLPLIPLPLRVGLSSLVQRGLCSHWNALVDVYNGISSVLVLLEAAANLIFVSTYLLRLL